MQRLGAILVFYKSLFMWSFLINILLIMITPYIFIANLTKLFIFTLIVCFLDETKIRSKLLFCKSLDKLQIKLFGIIYLLDITITTVTLYTLKVFI